MKLAIVGYGKMGRLIEQLAPEYGFTVQARIDLGDDFNQAAGDDVAVEFTMPDAVAANVEALAALRIPVVVGTTGWLNSMERARAAVEKNGSAMVWSPNFLDRRKRFFETGAGSCEDCSRTNRNMEPGPGRFIITPKKMLRQGRWRSWSTI